MQKVPQNEIGGEIHIRDYSEPLQNQVETTTSYSSRYVYPMDFNYSIDANNIANFENQMIGIWRSMAKNAYVDFAVDDIVNEMISYTDEQKYPIDIDLNNTSFSKRIRNLIHDEWINIMKLLKFHKKSYTLIRDWFIDGKQYFLLEYSKKTITNIITLDPCRLQKIIEKQPDSKEEDIYYIYNNIENIKDASSTQAEIKIDKEHIIEINSGLMDDSHQIWISYLNKAYVPLNQLNNIEDSLLIYRIARAPERRVIYIDTGQLPKSKAETYMKEVIRQLRNKVEYDPATGKIKESSLHMSLLDDIYLPRSSESQGTEISTLQGGTGGFADLSDLDYFKQKLFRALNIPYTRWSENTAPYGVLGRSAEITRDEVKYRKFIIRLRNVYNVLFTKLLRLQLSLKNIITQKEFNDNYENINYMWSSDSAFTELRDMELLDERVNLIDKLNNYAGTYFSQNFIKQKILKMTDAEIEQLKLEIDAEKEMTQPEGGEGGGDMGGGDTGDNLGF